MASVGGRQSQLTILPELLDVREGEFQVNTANNILQKCEVLCYKEL
jgi:hypothetical protein